MSSMAAIGGDWTCTLYYTPNAKIPGGNAKEVSHEELHSFLDQETGQDRIEQVSIYKQNLSWLFPKWFGAWHEFTVVESTNWYWSFEKNQEGIRVQRSKCEESVKYKYRGTDRIDVEGEGRPSRNVTGYGETMQHVFNWIYDENYLRTGYHLTESNCHYFASLLFEAIARQKGRKLRRK